MQIGGVYFETTSLAHRQLHFLEHCQALFVITKTICESEHLSWLDHFGIDAVKETIH
jgi:hypothetical protein